MFSGPSLRRLAVLVLLAVAPLLGLLGRRASTAAGPSPLDTPSLRRPVALALGDGGRTLYVANRGGSVSRLDAAALRVTAEAAVGRRLADLAVLSDGRLLAVDEAANELLVLSPKLDVLHRLTVSHTPVSVRPSADGSACFVASLWSRRLTFVDLGGKAPRVAATVALPFAPRRQLPLEKAGKLLVADAFGGRLAVVDLARMTVDSVRELPGHNVGGLALTADGKDIVVSQQVVSKLAKTSQDDIHWGNLLANYLRLVPLADVLRPDADLVANSRLLPVGDFGHGTGDPAGLAVAPDNTVVLALAGVGEVAVGPAGEGRLRYVEVGRRPAAVALSLDGRRAFVANTFGDSVSVVDLSEKKKTSEVALGQARPLTAAERGEVLFHDARLTHDHWFSCHSCHTDGHTNGQLVDTLGDDTFGTPKRVLTLLGVKDTGPFAWNGGKPDLESQVRATLRTTMHGLSPAKDGQVRDLLAYLGTLQPPPPAEKADPEKVMRGKGVFEARGCVSCHAPPTYTTPKAYDVGLRDEAGDKLFNPPSLRGVGQGGPYFHDGRAATLEEVFKKHRHQVKGEFVKGELEDLLTFLRQI